ncbi:MAG: hypothetical protein MPK62_01165 [Alphaproteobacteria bacterium]|nr:hypothetical protein [Alphaproteobacteria bacterium]MDA8029745.1 hypothetical protein [Alphaproteobacteria bacterium]
MTGNTNPGGRSQAMVRLRAEKFVKDWQGEDVIEAAESHTFWDEFFHIFEMRWVI